MTERFRIYLIVLASMLCTGHASANPSNENLHCIGQNENLICFDKKSKVFGLVSQFAQNTTQLTQKRRDEFMAYADKLAMTDDGRAQGSEGEQRFYAQYNPVEDKTLSASWTKHVHDELMNYPNDATTYTFPVMSIVAPPRTVPLQAVSYWFSFLRRDLFNVVIDDKAVVVRLGNGLMEVIYEPNTKHINPIIRQKLQDIVGFQASDQILVESAIKRLNALFSEILSREITGVFALLHEGNNSKLIAQFISGPGDSMKKDETEASFLVQYLANKPRHVFVTHGEAHAPFTTPLLGNLYIAEKDVRRLERAGLIRQLFRHESTHVRLNAVPAIEKFSSMMDSMNLLVDNKIKQQEIEGRMLDPFRSSYSSVEELIVDLPILATDDGDQYLAMLKLLLPVQNHRLLMGESLRKYLIECRNTFQSAELARVDVLWQTGIFVTEGSAQHTIHMADVFYQKLLAFQKEVDRDVVAQKFLSLFDVGMFQRDYANFVKAREILKSSGFYEHYDAYLQSSSQTGER